MCGASAQVVLMLRTYCVEGLGAPQPLLLWFFLSMK